MNLKSFNQQSLSPFQLYLLTALLFFSVLPHFFNLSIFIALFFTAVLGLRIVTYKYSLHKLPRWFIFISLFIGIVVVVFIYSGKIGKDFGVSLLVAMLALKILEVRTRRDAYVLCFITAFLLVTQFLYNQEIIFSIYIFLMAFFNLAYLFWLNQTNMTTASPLNHLGSIGRLFLQAIPVMVVLFILFPRLNGPLWGFDQGIKSAVTGVSDKLSPGSISQLSKSSATAFRVKFDNPEELPEPQYRYWRGPVISYTDGINWQANKTSKPAKINYKVLGPTVNYQLTMEPSQQHWVFALDMPASLPRDTYVTSSYSVKSDDKINKRTTFSLASNPYYSISDNSDNNLFEALVLPNNVTQRMRDFVETFQAESPTDEDFVNAVLNHFNQENFIYSLNPPQMLENPTDEFLFEHRKGFCEHYASSFVILMRMADIPARVVAGYQGGEWNPTGEHLVVRQSDAHAWAEIWLGEKGWVRIDPTSSVAPERVEQSIDPEGFSAGGEVVFKVDSDGLLGHLYKEAAWMLDSLDLNWHRWVVGFSQKRQNRLLDMSGLGFLKGYNLGIAAIVVTFVVIVVLTLLFRNKVVDKRDQARKLWDKFTRKLEAKGITINVYDGPLTIASKANLLFPDKKHSINLITKYYIASHYGKQQTKEKLIELRRLIKAFN